MRWGGQSSVEGARSKALAADCRRIARESRPIHTVRPFKNEKRGGRDGVGFSGRGAGQQPRTSCLAAIAASLLRAVARIAASDALLHAIAAAAAAASGVFLGVQKGAAVAIFAHALLEVAARLRAVVVRQRPLVGAGAAAAAASIVISGASSARDDDDDGGDSDGDSTAADELLLEAPPLLRTL